MIKMREHTIPVPYGDFVDGMQAMADLDSVRAIIENGDGYASDSILAVLGIPIKEKKDA